MIDPGELDRPIEIEVNTPTSSDYGTSDVDGFSKLCDDWAKLEFGGGGEKDEADQRRAVYDYAFIIHYRSGIAEDDRIKYDSEYYTITGIEEIERKEFLKIMTEKR